MTTQHLLLSFLFLFSTTALLAQKKNIKLPDQLKEASGLYIAAPDSLYWLNDSGDLPQLYLTNAKGRLTDIIPLPVRNVDWEDLTHDDAGNIYIGDFGNNRNNRQDLKIYIFHPQEGTLDSIEYAYPDQTTFPPPMEERNFNMEGFFWFQDSLHLFSKNEVGRGNGFTKHYRLPAQAGVQLLDLQDSLYLKNRVVTGAAMSPDREAVALLTYNYGFFLKLFPFSKVSIYLFQDFNDTRFLRVPSKEQKIHICSPVSQYEAIDFLTDNQVLIGSERAFFYGPKVKWLRLKKRRRTANQP